LSLCLDARILSEYADVLHRRKFGFSPDLVGILLDFIVISGHTIASSPLPQPLLDPDDEPFLQVAAAAKAEYLVTGNLAYFPENLRGNVRVVSPAEFVTILGSRRMENR
jgi:predicted nucleic acid-binding protein